MAVATVAFYGLCIEIRQDEIDSLEERTHSDIVTARKYRLDHYWGNFGTVGERYLLFIGKNLGIIGPEGCDELRMTVDEIDRIAAIVSQQLSSAGYNAIPELLLHFHRD